MMAFAKQLTPIPESLVAKRSCASRQFANAHPENTLEQDREGPLVLAAKSGDAHAFEVLIERSQRRVLAVARHITAQREDAEDIVQQSFQKAFVHLQKFEGKSSFATWLTRIAINEALMWLRRAHGVREVSTDDLSANEGTPLGLEIPDSRADPESVFLQDERSRILSAAMDELSPGTRAAIELRELRELTTKEAARVMGVSVGAVKARVFQGRKKLSRVLLREPPGNPGKTTRWPTLKRTASRAVHSSAVSVISPATK